MVPLRFFPPSTGHCETGVCVCPLCRTGMRLAGIEPHPRRNDGVDLFTYECVCGALHADVVRLQNLLGVPLDIEITD
jgi:hypothetical protein